MAKKPVLIPVVTCPPWTGHDGGIVPAKRPERRCIPHYVSGRFDPEQRPDLTWTYAGSPEFLWPGAFPPESVYGRTKAFPTEWIESPTWTGAIEVLGYHGGRSSSCYEVAIHDGSGLPPVAGLMSCSEFLAVIPHLSGNRAEGVFCAQKLGNNYMIRRISLGRVTK